MFARPLKYWSFGFSVLLAPACNNDVVAPLEYYTGFASGANVVPAPASGNASVFVLPSSNGLLVYTYGVFAPPSGTIDLIALYQAAPGDVLPDLATAVLCDGEEACAERGGYGTIVPPATAATIRAAILANEMQLVFFTTTAPKASGGAMRGTMLTAYSPRY